MDNGDYHRHHLQSEHDFALTLSFDPFNASLSRVRAIYVADNKALLHDEGLDNSFNDDSQDEENHRPLEVLSHHSPGNESVIITYLKSLSYPLTASSF